MSRAEKRRQLKALKEAKALEKGARLRERPSAANEIRVLADPGQAKLIRVGKNPDSIMAECLSWCVTKADVAGAWSWDQARQWSEGDWSSYLNPAFAAFAKLTWAEIGAQTTGGKKRHKKHHDQPIETIVAEAQERWAEIGLDEYDTAYRFRLGGKQRVWGFRVRAHFHLVWWDPGHRIYPVG